MGDVFEESLFNKQPRQFNEIDVQARAFAANYCGNTIIRDSRLLRIMHEKENCLWKY